MTSRLSGRTAVLAFAMGVVVSCGGHSGPSASTPAAPPTAPTPSSSQLGISVGCGPLRTGTYYGLACIAMVSDTNAPSNYSYRVQADLRIFGGSAEAPPFGFPKCPACGGPPWTYDMDLRVPADMTPGVKTFAVWVIDGEGHRADTTATVEIVAP
jgi:hypothetical protein